MEKSQTAGGIFYFNLLSSHRWKDYGDWCFVCLFVITQVCFPIGLLIDKLQLLQNRETQILSVVANALSLAVMLLHPQTPNWQRRLV